jgi:hypothetical protein
MNIVFLLGAGASKGAFDDPAFQPPLGTDLFGCLVEAFPNTWGALPDHVAADFHDEDFGFEKGMAALREEGEATQRALIDMSVYFSRFRIPHTGTNRYLDLFKGVNLLASTASLTVGSLNYECLAEMSLCALGDATYYWGAPPNAASRSVRVIKPHGSCNFVADTGTNSITNVTFHGVGHYVESLVKVVGLDEVVGGQLTGFPSVMSLYAPGKPDVMCHGFMQLLRTDWASAVNDADVLVVVGARPAVGSDSHIWQPILNSSALVLFIGDLDPVFQSEVGLRLSVLNTRFDSGLPSLMETLRALL